MATFNRERLKKFIKVSYGLIHSYNCIWILINIEEMTFNAILNKIFIFIFSLGSKKS